MIDPFAITKFDRTTAELEEFWLFCIAVAGKKATGIAAKLEAFLTDCGHPGTPFDRVRAMLAEGSLRQHMERVRLGKYRVLEKAYRQTLECGLDLRTATVEELEAIHGVASKTARFFVLHSRRDAEVAVIDTHMLKHLRALGYDAPRTVPTGRKYAVLEQVVLNEVRKSGLSAAEYDLGVWSRYASGEIKEERHRRRPASSPKSFNKASA